MKQIVEGGRKRAEVDWPGHWRRAFVRFDTDFIDGYSRDVKTNWRSGWADIARAEIKARFGGADLVMTEIVLTEREGRRLTIPFTAETWAAVRFLLPSDAEIQQPELTPGRRANVPAWVCFGMGALAFAAWFSVRMTYGPGNGLLPLTLAVGAAGGFSMGLVLFIVGSGARWRWKKAEAQRHDASVVWQIQGILDEQERWFESEKPAPMLRQRLTLALAIGTAAFGGLLLWWVDLPPLVSSVFLPVLASWIACLLLIHFISRKVRHAPMGSRVRLKEDRAELFLPGDPEPIPFQPAAYSLGQRVRTRMGPVQVRLDAFKMIPTPVEWDEEE